MPIITGTPPPTPPPAKPIPKCSEKGSGGVVNFKSARNVPVIFLHIGTRSVHKNIVNIVAEFEKNGSLKPNSEEALKNLVDGNKDYVIGFSGHSIPIKNGKPNKFTYTKEVNGKMAGKVETAGAMKSISDCLKVKGSSVVGLVDGHCVSKTRSLSEMLKGLGHELDASRIHSTNKKTTVEATRLAGLEMVRKS